MGQPPIKRTPIIYFIVVRLAKLGLSLFFQKIEVRHGENIPDKAPVILASNHPSSQMDAMLISTITSRMVHHIAHAGLFSRRFRAWFLRSSGVIPVRRRQGAEDAPDRNVDMFASCFEVLERGGALSIFPEGVSDARRRVKKIKTGAARIALDAERKNGYTLGVQLIPIGLHFFSRSRFRSKVLVNVGRSIDLKPFFGVNEQNGQEAVRRVTEALQKHLEDLTINIKYPELEEFIRDLDIIYRDELLSEAPQGGKVSTKTVEDFVLSQKIAECVEYYHERDPRLVQNMREKVDLYKRKLKRCRLKDAMLKERQKPGGILRRELFNITKALWGFPFACYGIINNYIPFRFTGQLAKRYLSERSKILMALFLGGSAAFLTCYAIQVFAVWLNWGAVWASAYFASLPISGFFALGYLKRVREERERISYSLFLFTRRHLVGKMRYARKQLISELDRIKDEYLSLTKDQAEAPKKSLTDSRILKAVAGDIGHAISLERLGPRISERVIWRVETGEPVVALTFDDGPHATSTPSILEVLERNHVPATFFLVGKHLAAHPDIARRILDAGHEIGNHTFSHPKLIFLTEKQVRKEIEQTDELLEDLNGSNRSKYMRPPSGFFNKKILDIAEDLGYRVVVGDVYPRDSHNPGSAKIVQRVLDRAAPGSIIILHDGGNVGRVDRSQTREALEEVIPRLREKGYEFAPLSGLIAKEVQVP